jgi:hypothetical protein
VLRLLDQDADVAGEIFYWEMIGPFGENGKDLPSRLGQ